MNEPRFVHNQSGWWRPEGKGYSSSLLEAGWYPPDWTPWRKEDKVYTVAEACELEGLTPEKLRDVAKRAIELAEMLEKKR